jgi:L-histidine N-alpha-methyltransferase
VELGSGTSEKTTLLLDALHDAGRLRRFVPFDVCEPVLRDAAATIAARYDGLGVIAVVGDFEHHLDEIPDVGRRLIVFLGGTIGNLVPDERARFLSAIADQMGPDDAFLLGTDLVKDIGRLEAAYDDSAGVTAAFNKTVLAVINDRLGANFAPARFEHVARFDTDNEWIEMHLRSTEDQTVTIRDLDLTVQFAAGEHMRTEISAKFTRPRVEAELLAAGLKPAEFWTDPAGDFAVSLAFGG